MDPFLGEIRPVPYNFAPQGWAFCNGQIMAIAQNTALFSLLGTQFGGNGTTTFGLPDLRSRVPVGAGSSPSGNYSVGDMDGVESVTLTNQEMPTHTHGTQVSNNAADTVNPQDQVPSIGSHNLYLPTSNGTLNPNAVTTAGGNQPHSNIQPYTAISYIIALQGIFPQRP
jgi:microcystin-dependent protein